MNAMVLAAGLGLRMRPITERIPKPLIAVGGRTLLDRALDHLVRAGVGEAVVNSYYLADQIRGHLAERARPRITLSHEDALLETGGGVAKALSLLGPAPFFVANADVLWLDGPTSALSRLVASWNDATMDALLLVHPTVRAFGYSGRGDFFLDQLGVARRRRDLEVAPYVFTGVQILHPRLFDAAPSGPFSLNRLYDRAESVGRLWAIVHDGAWFHVGTPAALAEAEAELAGRSAPHLRRFV